MSSFATKYLLLFPVSGTRVSSKNSRRTLQWPKEISAQSPTCPIMQFFHAFLYVPLFELVVHNYYINECGLNEFYLNLNSIFISPIQYHTQYGMR